MFQLVRGKLPSLYRDVTAPITSYPNAAPLFVPLLFSTVTEALYAQLDHAAYVGLFNKTVGGVYLSPHVDRVSGEGRYVVPAR